MHIACIAADLIPNKLGGAEVHAVEIIKRLSQKHQIILFVGADDSIKTLFNKNVTVIPVNYPRIPNFYGLSYILFSYSQVLSKILDLGSKIDVVWAKQCFPQAPVAARLAKTLNLPLYITAQNPRLLHEELVIKGSFIKPFHTLLANLLDPLIAWSFRQAHCVAAVSHYSAILAKQYGAKKVVIIPNGISPLDFKMHKYSPKKTWTLFTSSSLIPRNGIDTLIEAVALLPKNISWKLLIAGDGPLFSNFKFQISNLGLKDKIKLFGRVSNDEIPRLLSQSDLFIRPSRFEGFGVAFLEAMASGVPVIATPVGGIIDFVKDNETGLLVDVDNPQALAKAIEHIFTNAALYKHIQAHALDLSRKHYNWDAITRQVEAKMNLLVTRNP